MLQDTNKKFSAAIGEPWDFKSADGENILKGTINKVLTVNGNTILFARTSDFFYEGIKINNVCMISRYYGETLSAERDDEQTCNIYFSTEGKTICADGIEDFLNHAEKKSFLIGSIIIHDV